MSDSLWPHWLQDPRPPCPSPTPGACSNSCLLSQWCHATISSSVLPFFSHLQSFPASGSFQMSQFFTSGGQSIGVSASASILPMVIPNWFPLGWTGFIPLLSKELSSVFSNSRFSLVVYFMHSCIYTSLPITQSLLPPCPIGIHLFSVTVSLFLLHK